MTNKILLSDEGRSFIPIYMKPYNDITLSQVRFKVDTGADLTTISKQELVYLGYSYEWIEKNTIESQSHTLARAGGNPHPACYVQIDIANVLGCELLNWPFYIRKEPNLDFPNLLGINILAHFDFSFNYSSWMFEIAYSKNPKNSLPMLSDQSIHEINKGNSEI